MKSFRSKVLLIVGIVVVAVVGALLTQSDQKQWTRYTGSTYSSGPRGCKALYVLLEELQLPVMRLRRPLLRLSACRGVLVIAGPSLVPFEKREIASLKKWVREGNQLIIFDGVRSLSFLREPSDSSRNSPRKSSIRPSLHSPSSSFGLKIKEHTGTSPSTLTVTLPGMKGTARIRVSGVTRWSGVPKGWTELVGDPEGPIFVSRKLGKGGVVAIADSSFPSNRQLSQEQNLRMVLALLLAERKPEQILFEEYHHGHGISESFWSHAGSSVLALVLVQSLLGFGLFFFSKRAQQGGRYRSLTAERGRSSLEYVDSMATLYKSSGAGALALESVLRRVLQLISRRAGIQPKRIEEDPSDRVGKLTGENPQELADLLQECRQVAQSGEDTDRAVVLARRLTTIGQRIRGSTSASHRG